MNFYRCQSCSHVFADGDGVRVQDHLGVTDPYPVYVTYIGCPECHGEDLDDFDPCDTDDCEQEAADGYDYCAECQSRMDAEEARALADYRAEQEASPCGEVCEIHEHKGYRDCRETGQCAKLALHNPAPLLPEGVRPPSASRRTEPEPGRGAALFFLAVVLPLVCAWMGD